MFIILSLYNRIWDYGCSYLSTAIVHHSHSSVAMVTRQNKAHF